MIPSGYSGLLVGMEETGKSAAWEFDNFELRVIGTRGDPNPRGHRYPISTFCNLKQEIP